MRGENISQVYVKKMRERTRDGETWIEMVRDRDGERWRERWRQMERERWTEMEREMQNT